MLPLCSDPEAEMVAWYCDYRFDIESIMNKIEKDEH